MNPVMIDDNFTKAIYQLVSINYRKSVKNIVQQLQFIFL